MVTIELSDPDGDALTVTTSADGIWFTCTSGDAEVTVGPFPVASVLSSLTESGQCGREPLALIRPLRSTPWPVTHTERHR